MKATEDSLFRVYPNTCEECPERGEIEVFGHYYSGDMVYLFDKEQQEKRWRSTGWPVRCKPCNAKAQARKRANSTIHRLEELRIMVHETFTALDENTESTGGDRWCFLKFVTLTWKNESVTESEPDMKKARKWLHRKRLKIINHLDVLGGTDVLECVTKKNASGTFHHHVHSHGIWLMPYHDIEYIGEIMKRYVGRDQVRAIMPKTVMNKEGNEFMVSAFAQARNYVMKYLSKQPNTRRSSWGIVRKNLTAETFYGDCTRIWKKWSV